MRRPSVRSLGALIAAALAGCGGGSDAPAAGPASVVVWNATGPLAGADVVFHDAQGLPTAHVTTGPTGRATADVEPGGMLTVLLLEGDDRFRGTITAVSPGDELVLRSTRVSVFPVGVARIQVSPCPGAVTYVIQAACSTVYTGDVTDPVELEVRTNCLSADGRLHLLVTAMDGDGVILAKTSARDLSWSEPMNVVMGPWESMSTLTIEATNAPPGSTTATLGIQYVVRGLLLSGASTTAPLVPGQGTSRALQLAPGFADQVQVELSVLFGGGPMDFDGVSGILERRAASAASRSVDLGKALLPRIAPPVVDDADPVRPSAELSAAGSLAAADGGVVRFEWTDEPGGPTEGWSLLVPPGVARPVKLPRLPALVAAWAPGEGAQLESCTAAFVDASWIDSYAALRNGDLATALLRGDARRLPEHDATLRLTVAGF